MKDLKLDIPTGSDAETAVIPIRLMGVFLLRLAIRHRDALDALQNGKGNMDEKYWLHTEKARSTA